MFRMSDGTKNYTLEVGDVRWREADLLDLPGFSPVEGLVDADAATAAYHDLVERQGRGRPRRKRLSPHFRPQEFDCNDGTVYLRGRGRTYEYMCNVFLEPLRDEFGVCFVHSGYRTREYNRRIGGAPHSVHVNEDQDVDDVATDLSFARGTPSQWAAMADRIRTRERGGRGGIGRYASFIHVDCRDYKADWTG